MEEDLGVGGGEGSGEPRPLPGAGELGGMLDDEPSAETGGHSLQEPANVQPQQQPSAEAPPNDSRTEESIDEGWAGDSGGPGSGVEVSGEGFVGQLVSSGGFVGEQSGGGGGFVGQRVSSGSPAAEEDSGSSWAGESGWGESPLGSVRTDDDEAAEDDGAAEGDEPLLEDPAPPEDDGAASDRDSLQDLQEQLEDEAAQHEPDR